MYDISSSPNLVVKLLSELNISLDWYVILLKTSFLHQLINCHLSIFLFFIKWMTNFVMFNLSFQTCSLVLPICVHTQIMTSTETSRRASISPIYWSTPCIFSKSTITTQTKIVEIVFSILDFWVLVTIQFYMNN